MKKFLQVLLVVVVLFLGMMKVAHAASLVNLDIKNNGVVIYSGTIPLSPTPSENSVLSVIKQADTLSPDFNISNIVHYSFGDYLKCITISETTELCDSWLYKVNGDSPAMGMDSYTLSGGENVLLYFGDDVTTEGNTVTSSGGPITYVPSPILNPPTLSPTIPPFSPSLVPLITVLPTSLTPESKSPVLPLQETKKMVLIPKLKAREKKLSVTEKENTTTTINAIQDTMVQIPTPKKNWFKRLLDSIFGN